MRALVRRCAARVGTSVPLLASKVAGLHVIRHATATHLLRAGLDSNAIRAWPGHVKLSTPHIHAGIDPETEAQAIAPCDGSESAAAAHGTTGGV